jgi:hypothetical protein
MKAPQVWAQSTPARRGSRGTAAATFAPEMQLTDPEVVSTNVGNTSRDCADTLTATQ